MTISNIKDAGRPKTVKIKPRLSSIHLIKRLRNCDPSSSTFPDPVETVVDSILILISSKDSSAKAIQNNTFQ